MLELDSGARRPANGTFHGISSSGISAPDRKATPGGPAAADSRARAAAGLGQLCQQSASEQTAVSPASLLLRRLRLAFSPLLLLLPVASAMAGDLVVTLRGVPSAEGMVRVAARRPERRPGGHLPIAGAPARPGTMNCASPACRRRRPLRLPRRRGWRYGKLGKDWLGRRLEAVGFGKRRPIGRFGPAGVRGRRGRRPASGTARRAVSLRTRGARPQTLRSHLLDCIPISPPSRAGAQALAEPAPPPLTAAGHAASRRMPCRSWATRRAGRSSRPRLMSAPCTPAEELARSTRHPGLAPSPGAGGGLLALSGELTIATEMLATAERVQQDTEGGRCLGGSPVRRPDRGRQPDRLDPRASVFRGGAPGRRRHPGR